MNISTPSWGIPVQSGASRFSLDGKILASGSYDGTVLLWETPPFPEPYITVSILASQGSCLLFPARLGLANILAIETEFCRKTSVSEMT